MKLPHLTVPYRRLLIALIVLLLVGGAYIVTRQRSTVATNQPPFTALNARVVWSDEVFRIINLENRPWLHCEFLLNKQYSFVREKVQAREVLQVAHTVFESRVSGAPYRYEADPPSSFSIRCENVGGNVGLFSGNYAADAVPTE